MNIVFEKIEQIKRKCLLQGDVIRRSDTLIELLREPHSYYATAEDYNYFMVLTQSCDLVKRDNKIKADYITIAAIKPLNNYVERALDRFSKKIPDAKVRILDSGQTKIARQLSDRLVHNTVPDIFFLPKEDKLGFTEDCCVILQLSIALKPHHYDALLDAKVAQLKEIFAAKLGRLVGDLYSRVGTPDISDHVPNPDEFKKSFFENVFAREMLVLSKNQKKKMKKIVQDWRDANPRVELDSTKVKELSEELPRQSDLVIARVLKTLEEKKCIDPTNLDAARIALESDAGWKNLAKELD